jgi:hypothetical protein
MPTLLLCVTLQADGDGGSVTAVEDASLVDPPMRWRDRAPEAPCGVGTLRAAVLSAISSDPDDVTARIPAPTRTAGASRCRAGTRRQCRLATARGRWRTRGSSLTQVSFRVRSAVWMSGFLPDTMYSGRIWTSRALRGFGNQPRSRAQACSVQSSSLLIYALPRASSGAAPYARPCSGSSRSATARCSSLAATTGDADRGKLRRRSKP